MGVVVPILSLMVTFHVQCAQSLRLVNEGPLLRLGQLLPIGAEPLAYFAVVHLRVLLGHLATLSSRPDLSKEDDEGN